MKIVVFFFFFNTFFINAQIEDKKYEFQDSLMSVSMFKNIKLNEKVSLKAGLTVRKRTIFNTFETPIFMDYQISERWSAYIGAHSRTVINTNFPGLEEIFDKPSTIFYSVGSEFQFNDKSSGHFSINFPLEFNLGFKF